MKSLDEKAKIALDDYKCELDRGITDTSIIIEDAFLSGYDAGFSAAINVLKKLFKERKL